MIATEVGEALKIVKEVWGRGVAAGAPQVGPSHFPALRTYKVYKVYKQSPPQGKPFLTIEWSEYLTLPLVTHFSSNKAIPTATILYLLI